MTPLAYTPAEVAALLKMSKASVYRQIALGTIPARRYGRLVRVPAWWVKEQVEKAA